MNVLPFKLPEDPDSRFAILSRRAIVALEAAVEAAPDGRTTSFRLWHYPPTGSWRAWTLFVPPGIDFRLGEAVVREFRWDADGDRDRLIRGVPSDTTLDPSLGESEGILERRAAERVLREASALGLGMRQIVKPFERSTLTRYGIEGYATRSNPIRVEWDTPVPAGMGPIAAWYSRTRLIFESSLGKRS